MIWNKNSITQSLRPINDLHMQNLRQQWFNSAQKEINYTQFKPIASEWFRDSALNNIQGWEQFPLVDVTMGNTHYIESFLLKHGMQGFQILKNEYSYYTLIGKHGVDVDALEPNKPLIITMPHWQYCDIRPEWSEVLRICEQRNIDIHIDMAWIITARDIDVDLSHPCIKSFAMSLSKLNLQWARVGLRWSRQKSMDSVTIFNDYYRQTNTVLTSVGTFFIEQLERDYLWNTHGANHYNLCQLFDLQSTKIIHVAKDKNTNQSLGIGNLLSSVAPD
jgi:hypothetical protein